MLNTTGEALTSISPGGVGRVSAHGEIWTATAEEPVSAGDRVMITAIKGLLLTVKRA
jgi:membrane protein implicated in regulation of membrane protease activity